MMIVAQGPYDLVPWLHAFMQHAQNDNAAASVRQETCYVIKAVCGAAAPACCKLQMEKPDTRRDP
ncbi:hypothetical protein ADZ37_00560 [Pannonibacter phragmitetus]|nr:hypothetical protein [Pannonibacter phragmitetus]KND21040.1 hypothetical protein ADZ37_00560 [Pannonibacter phragmitetus]